MNVGGNSQWGCNSWVHSTCIIPEYEPCDGQGGMACCDSWGHKESDTTERLNWLTECLYTHINCTAHISELIICGSSDKLQWPKNWCFLIPLLEVSLLTLWCLKTNGSFYISNFLWSGICKLWCQVTCKTNQAQELGDVSFSSLLTLRNVLLTIIRSSN